MTRGRPITLSDEDLLDAAEKVFLERGLEASTTEIAERVRISESVIFHRFKTKRALFKAVFERVVVIPPAAARLPSLVGKNEIANNLFDAGLGVAEMLEKTMPLLMMALSSPKMNVLRKHAVISTPFKQAVNDLFTSYCEGEVRAGRMRQINGQVFAHTFLGAIMKYVVTEKLEGGRDPMTTPEFLRQVIDMLLRGTQPEGT